MTPSLGLPLLHHHPVPACDRDPPSPWVPPGLCLANERHGKSGGNLCGVFSLASGWWVTILSPDTTPLLPRSRRERARVPATSSPHQLPRAAGLLQPLRALSFLSRSLVRSHETPVTCAQAMKKSQLAHAVTSAIFVPAGYCTVRQWDGHHHGLLLSVEPGKVTIPRRGARAMGGQGGAEGGYALPAWSCSPGPASHTSWRAHEVREGWRDG